MEIEKLNRFTTLPILLDFLSKQKLMLLDPSSWDDKNDTLILEEYKKQFKISKLFALCFTHESETIHHWKTFANGSSGCCIEFDAKPFLSILDNTKNLRHGIVRYLKIKELNDPNIVIYDFPFIKRNPYKFEREFRIIWEGETENNYFELEIPLTLIRRITFSQQMPKSVFDSIRKLIVNNYPILDTKINRSTIYENQRWVKTFQND